MVNYSGFAWSIILDLGGQLTWIIQKDDLIIFPNPAQEEICIDTEDNFEVLEVEILDINAKKLYQGTGNCHDIKNIPSGLYQLVVSNKLSKRIGRFIKK